MRNAYNEEPFSLEVGGRTVYGMIHHAEHPKAVVISAHGLNGERVDAHRILVLFSRQCAASQIVSVRFDFSGCGITETEFRESTIRSRTEELLAVTAMIRARYAGIPVIHHGFSDGSRIVYDAFPSALPDGCVFWSPILLPSQAEDADIADVPWVRLPGERRPVKPFLGLWLGFSYVREYGRLKQHDFADKPVMIFRGSLDSAVNESIRTLQENRCMLTEIADCGHIYETRPATAQIIRETIQWIGEQTA